LAVSEIGCQYSPAVMSFLSRALARLWISCEYPHHHTAHRHWGSGDGQPSPGSGPSPPVDAPDLALAVEHIEATSDQEPDLRETLAQRSTSAGRNLPGRHDNSRVKVISVGGWLTRYSPQPIPGQHPPVLLVQPDFSQRCSGLLHSAFRTFAETRRAIFRFGITNRA
jgi:hypothetical protein